VARVQLCDMTRAPDTPKPPTRVLGKLVLRLFHALGSIPGA
jgi:hypothetical protein